MSNTTIRLLGVPEQVNLPIKLCLQHYIFNKYNINVVYEEISKGTGLMLQMIDEDKADLAICVTDGYINGKAKGSSGELCGVYVESPLCWAVCSNNSNNIYTVNDLITNAKQNNKLRVGISRYSSGSHTMSFYLCELFDFDSKLIEFIVLHDFNGLKQGVIDNVVDIFLWETFTTKPDFDTGIIRKIGEINTPWPAFSFISRPSSSLSSDLIAAIRDKFYPALYEGIKLFTTGNVTTLPYYHRDGVYESIDKSIQLIVTEFNHKYEDANSWMSIVRYNNSKMSISLDQINQSINIMKKIKLVPIDFTSDSLWGNNPISHIV